MKLLLRYWLRMRSSRGQTMGEYALVMAGVAIVAYTAYQFLGTQISTAASTIGSQL